MFGDNEITMRLPRGDVEALCDAIKRSELDAGQHIVAALKDFIESREGLNFDPMSNGEGPLTVCWPTDLDEPAIIRLPISDALELVRGGENSLRCFAKRLESQRQRLSFP